MQFQQLLPPESLPFLQISRKNEKIPFAEELFLGETVPKMG